MFTTTDAPPQPPRTTALMRALSLLFLGAIAFATLYPLTEWRLHAPSALAFLSAGLPRWWTWFDVLGNVVAYLMLGLLLTLGWLARLRPIAAVLVATLVCSALSLGLEATQSYLPSRVPSLLDWFANSGGGLAGAWLGATLNRAGGHADRIAVPVPERWYEQAPPGGWVLLLLWLSVQIVPQRLLFATGHVEPALQRVLDDLMPGDAPDLSYLASALWGDTAPTGYGVAIEAVTVVCAVCVVGSIAFSLVRGSRWRLALLSCIAVIAFGLRSIATQTVYGAGAPLAWLTPGAQGGLVVGAALLYGLETLGPRTRAVAAGLLLTVGTLLVNVAPADRYFETTLAGMQAGQLVNLQGLLRTVSLVWPLLAIVWFWRRARRAGARSL
jgi:VanZ family protein